MVTYFSALKQRTIMAPVSNIFSSMRYRVETLFFANHIMKILNNGSLSNTWSTKTQFPTVLKKNHKNQHPDHS